MSIDPSLPGSYQSGVCQCSWLESLRLSVEIGEPDFGSSRQSVSSGGEKHSHVTTPTITTVWEKESLLSCRMFLQRSNKHQYANTQVSIFHVVCRTTVEPPNNGHIGDEHFVHCSEVVPYSEVEMYGQYIGRGRAVCPL